MMRRILLATLALTAAVATACSSDDTAPNGSLPDGADLLKDAATAAADISSTHFTLQVNGEVPGLPVKSAEGDLTREGGPKGAAKGTISMNFMGNLFEGEFVLVEDTLFLKGPTGGYEEIPASLVRSVYDPAAILDPERGIAKVLSSVQNAKTEAAEDVDGVATYKVTGRVGKDVVTSLVPGINDDVDITFWVKQDGDHQPVKASVKVPAEGDPTVDVTLSDVGKPVSITAPQ
jgi:lipoprotein LprG